MRIHLIHGGNMKIFFIILLFTANAFAVEINWWNGDENYGTQDVEIRFINDADDMKYFCQHGAFGCKKSIGAKEIITVMTQEAHDMVAPNFDRDETVFHEFRHAFLKSNAHAPPHVPNNTDTRGIKFVTPQIEQYWASPDKMAVVGRMILKLLKGNNNEPSGP